VALLLSGDFFLPFPAGVPADVSSSSSFYVPIGYDPFIVSPPELEWQVLDEPKFYPPNISLFSYSFLSAAVLDFFIQSRPPPLGLFFTTPFFSPNLCIDASCPAAILAIFSRACAQEK